MTIPDLSLSARRERALTALDAEHAAARLTVQRRFLTEALFAAGGNRARAAILLGIERRTVGYWIAADAAAGTEIEGEPIADLVARMGWTKGQKKKA